MRAFKKVINVMLVIILLITAGLYYINKNPIQMPINIPYKNDIVISSEKISITYSDFKIKITSKDILLTKEKKESFSINDAVLNIDLWLLTSNFTAKLKKAEIIPFIYPNYAKNNKIRFDGSVKVNLLLLKPLKLDLNLTSNDGVIVPESADLEKTKLESFLLTLVYKSNKISVKKLKFSYENGIKANLAGDFLLENNTLSSAVFKSEVYDLPINYLKYLWPEILFPKIQNWVTSHISNGIVNKANGDFIITKDALSKKNLPKEAINAEIEVSDATLNYLDEYSPIRNLNGKVVFNGSNLSVYSEHANLKNSHLNNISLTLAFQSLTLVLQTKFSGKISQFEEFIPNQAIQKLNKYHINFSKAKGNVAGDLNLSLKIRQSFSEEDLTLNVAADISNLLVKKHESLKLNKAKIKLEKIPHKMSLEINENKVLTLKLSHYHKKKIEKENYTDLSLIINADKELNLNSAILRSGTTRIDAKITKSSWQTKLDLSNAEIDLIYLGYIKEITKPLIVECNGDINSYSFESNNCVVSGGNEFSGIIKFNYQLDDEKITHFSFNDAKVGSNHFSFNIIAEKNFYIQTLEAKTLDLSKFNIDNANLNSKDSANNSFIFNIKKMICKNDIILENIRGKFKKHINRPPDIRISASSGEDRFILSRAIKNGENIYSLYSKNFAPFAKAVNLYKNIKKGEAWVQITPNQTKDGIEYTASFNLNSFALSNTSIITKVILGILSPINSLEAVVKSLRGGSLAADSFTGNINFKNSILTMKNGHLVGPSYAVKMNGYIDLNKNFLKFKGIYIPYMYGINKLVASIPILGKLIDGGSDSALIGANFTIRGEIKEPNIDFNPFSLLTPGFLRNIL